MLVDGPGPHVLGHAVALPVRHLLHGREGAGERGRSGSVPVLGQPKTLDRVGDHPGLPLRHPDLHREEVGRVEHQRIAGRVGVEHPSPGQRGSSDHPGEGVEVELQHEGRGHPRWTLPRLENRQRAVGLDPPPNPSRVAKGRVERDLPGTPTVGGGDPQEGQGRAESTDAGGEVIAAGIRMLLARQPFAFA